MIDGTLPSFPPRSRPVGTWTCPHCGQSLILFGALNGDDRAVKRHLDHCPAFLEDDDDDGHQADE